MPDIQNSTESRRRVSPAGLALIKRCESFSPTVYWCPAGKKTIGYGHVLRNDDMLYRRLTEEQGEELLHEDLAPVEIYLTGVFPALTPGEFDALGSFCFNVGLGAFEKSTMFARLKAGDHPGAASQFKLWVYGGTPPKVLPGLVFRREAERKLFVGEAA